MSRISQPAPRCSGPARRARAAATPLALGLVLSLAVAGSARAEVLTLGTASGTEACTGGFIAADAGTVVPAGGGTITSFAYGITPDTGGQRLDFVILRPAGYGAYAVVARTGMVTLPAGDGIASFPAELQARAGDIVGYYEEGLANCVRLRTGSSVPNRYVGHDPALGSSFIMDPVVGDASLNIAATLRVNRPPGAPDAPVPGTTLNRDGRQQLTWNAVTDPDAGDRVTYRLEHRRANSTAFSAVAAVDGTAYRFGADGPAEAEGTWTYRVVAIDGHGAESDPSPASAPVRVDRTAPPAPAVVTTPALAPVTLDGVRWFRDRVVVGFDGGADPLLADGSPGSGLAAVSPAAAVGPADADPATGAFSVSGTATDAAGNVSGATPLDARLDWKAPTATFTDCPSEPVLLHADADVRWAAADPAPSAGLGTPASGAVRLATGAAGPQTARSPAPGDAVGHTGEPAACGYVVDYAADGFLAPVRDLPAVNTGRGGRTVPLQWRLRDAAGRPVAGLGAVRTITYTATACGTTAGDGAERRPAAPAGGSRLRYDPGDGRYHFEWATPGRGCWTLAVELDSGQVLRAVFDLS